MTRGYVVITKDGKVIKYGYLSGDAYPSYCGERILQKVISGEISEYVDNIIKENHECYGNEEPNPDFSLDWIRKGKNNKKWKKYDFMEYGYLYKENTGVLHVYNYGKLLYKISPEERKKYLYLLSHERGIMNILTYDPEKLEYNEKKVTRKKIEKLSLADMQELVKKWRKMDCDDMPVVDTYNRIVVGSSMECPAYARDVSFGRGKCLEFIVEKDRISNKWDILIQLPYMRAIVRRGFSSEKSATEGIRNIVKDNVERLARTAEIMNDIRLYTDKFDKEDLKGYIATLPTHWGLHPWYTAGDMFTVEKIQRYYMWNY